MNRIVRDHYPAEKLPEDLQKLVDPRRPVRLVIEQEENRPKPRKSSEELRAMIESCQRSRGDTGRTVEDVVAEIRALRDEWDD